MSDAEPEEDDTVENPDPEADSIAEPSANLNAEAESNNAENTRDTNSLTESHQNECSRENSDFDTVKASASGYQTDKSDSKLESADAVVGDSNVNPSAPDNPEGFSLDVHQRQSDAEGQSVGYGDVARSHNDSMTEGDQNQFRDQDFVAGNEILDQNIDNEYADPGSGFQGFNELAAEDEQYCPMSCVGADSNISLEPEGNIVFNGPVDIEGEGPVGASNDEKQNVASHRTESYCQLDEYASQQYAAGSANDQDVYREVSNAIEICEADGASASGQDVYLEPESELEENRAHLTLEREPEPTESDEETQPKELSEDVDVGEVNDNLGEFVTEDDAQQAGAECLDTVNDENVKLADTMSANAICDEKNVPDDEICAVATGKIESGSQSYQPECDQSGSDESQSKSSLNNIVAGVDNQGNHCIIDDKLAEKVEDNSESSAMARTLADQVVSDSRNVDDVESKEGRNTNNCDNNQVEDESSNIMAENDAESVNNRLAFTKDSGAIPKQREENGSNSNRNRTREMKQNDHTESNAIHRAKEDKDSEDELLSELDATLKDNSVEVDRNSRGSSGCVISQDLEEQTGEGGNAVSCDQCLRNHLQCSFRGTHHERGGNSNIPGVREIKKQLRQAKQMLLDRECEVSRLKEDLSDHRVRCETVTSERDANLKELECLKYNNSDDLYIPQIKELEYTIAQQNNEIRGLKDKLSSHDGAAKRAIATLQHEMKLRVDQVIKQSEEATKEKDTMVVKYAQAEHKNLEYQKQTDRAENKLKEMEKERDAFLVRMRAVKEQRSKLAAELEAKNTELANVHRELDKHRELVSSADVRVKWAQNKLKAELDAHKETKCQVDKMTVKVKEAKEETQQIRHDCQGIIKTYQESEEVKSNSLDKELKLKECELLEREVHHTNFELAHVKTQRELEQVKAELLDSQSKLSAVTDKLSTVENEKEQATLTATRYADITQRQKKEVQDLRERVESLVQYKTDFISAQELIKNLDTDISELKITNKEIVSEMDSCRRRETNKLELTAKLSRKNAELQSENSSLSNKVLTLTGDLQAVKMENQEADTTLKNLADSLASEQKQRQDESQSMNTKLVDKCKTVDDLTRKLDDEKDEIKTLKRKQVNNIKDLTRQLQQVRRKLESYEANTNGDKDTISMGSRTSSCGSLNTVSIADQTTTHVVQPSNLTQPNSVHRHPSPEQDYPVITEQIDIDKHTLIERIVKLQRALARKNEKIEFMEDHINQLVDEIQKKSRIIQSYILKEETGTMTTDYRDRVKAEISRKHSIMGSVYSSHSNDGSMTLDLSLEINRKLQAVLEDILLKNMTLKESLDTLGQEIARLSQENRRMQLQMQGKSRSRVNPSTR